MTPDIERLRSSLDQLEDQVEYLELEVVDDPNWEEPSDTSYLNKKDRANPHTMANVEAMDATNKLIDWFARDQEGYVGLWLGPDGTPHSKAPIVRLDSEGQYELVATTIGDYIAVSVDEDDFDAAHEALTDAGFKVAETIGAIWGTVSELKCPNDYRHILYNKGLIQRGLDPVDD